MAQRRHRAAPAELIDVDQVLLDYEHELISLGRLAELLGLNRDEAVELVEARGLEYRVGPETIEEAREEVRALRRIQGR